MADEIPVREFYVMNHILKYIFIRLMVQNHHCYDPPMAYLAICRMRRHNLRIKYISRCQLAHSRHSTAVESDCGASAFRLYYSYPAPAGYAHAHLYRRRHLNLFLVFYHISMNIIADFIELLFDYYLQFLQIT